jgi:hypothetical protein
MVDDQTKKGAADAARGRLYTCRHAKSRLPPARGDPASNFTFASGDRAGTWREHAQRTSTGQFAGGLVWEKMASKSKRSCTEGYGPHGIAMLVECLTDNRNRTISEVRRAFTKANGALGEPGSVAWQFTEKGYLAFNRVDENGAVLDLDPDALFLAAIESGAADVELSAEVVEVYTDRTDFAQVSQAFRGTGLCGCPGRVGDAAKHDDRAWG